VRQTRHTDWSGILNEDHYGPGQVWEKTFPAGVAQMRGNNGGDGSYVMFVANPANAPEEPASTECPAGWMQVGEDGADIGGCGLQSCGERYWSNNPSECAEACAARSDCRGFNYAPMHGDRNHEAMTVCTLYNADAPTSSWYGSAGHVQIFCAPIQAAQCTGNYEAEDATISGAREHADSTTAPHQGFTGRSFVDYINPSNDYIEWTLPSCASGDVTLNFRYALAGGDRPLQVLLNGAEISHRMSTPATGSWGNYGTVALPATLVSGTNTVRLVAAGSSGANVDSLIVS
jgi:hypothetical protein